MSQYSQSGIEEYINHFENHKTHPTVQRVLGGNTTFLGLMEKFYDISLRSSYVKSYPDSDELGDIKIHPVPGDVKNIKIKRESPRKQDETKPEELTDILNIFSDEGLDRDKLHYGFIREGCEMWRKTKNKYNVIGTLAMLTGIGLISTSPLGGNSSETSYLLTQSITGALIFTGGYEFISSSPRPNEENPGLTELLKFHEAASRADIIMNDHYKDCFINKNLPSSTE